MLSWTAQSIIIMFAHLTQQNQRSGLLSTDQTAPLLQCHTQQQLYQDTEPQVKGDILLISIASVGQ